MQKGLYIDKIGDEKFKFGPFVNFFYEFNTKLIKISYIKLFLLGKYLS